LRGYLLDANHVDAYHLEHPTFIERLRQVPADTLVRICTITLGEIEAGLRITTTTDQARRDDYAVFIINELPLAIEVGVATRFYYAEIIERIFRRHSPPHGKKTKTEPHLLSLGVDINDLWTFAVAWEHGLTLLTQDKMTCIREVVSIEEVNVECWL